MSLTLQRYALRRHVLNNASQCRQSTGRTVCVSTAMSDRPKANSVRHVAATLVLSLPACVWVRKEQVPNMSEASPDVTHSTTIDDRRKALTCPVCPSCEQLPQQRLAHWRPSVLSARRRR